MTSISLIHAAGAPFDIERPANQIAVGLRADDAGFIPRLHTIGPGGTWRNVLAAARGLRASAPAIVHAFDGPSLLAAALGTRAPLVFTLPAGRLTSAVRLVRAIQDYRPVQAICPTAILHRKAVERGVAPERCHLIRPAVDFSRVRRRRDVELRQRLGIAPDDVIVLAPGEMTPAAGHIQAVWTLAILHTLDPRYRLLVWGRGGDVGRLERFASRMGPPELLVNAERRLGRRVEMEELLPAADLVLATGEEGVPVLPIALCMAAGLPIVASATYTHSELLEDHHNALLVSKAKPRTLARRILELRDDASLQWRLADMARVEAFEYFAQTRFLDQHRTVYAQLAAGQPVALEPVAAGAGLRFHGRG